MAEITLQSDVFKFVALRPPVTSDPRRQQLHFTSDTRLPEQTPVGELVSGFDPDDGTAIPRRTEQFIAENEYSLEFPPGHAGKQLVDIREFARSFSDDDISNDSLTSGIESILEQSIGDWLGSDESRQIRDGLWDRYYAYYILGRFSPQNLESLSQNLRVFHLLDLLDAGVPILNRASLDAVLAATLVVPKLFTDLPKPKVPRPDSASQEPAPEQVRQYKQLWADLVDTSRAIEEIKNI